MNKFLPSIINTLSNNSQSAISSIIKEIKSSKQDISSLISRLNSFRAEANFSPANFSALSEMNKQVFIDIFRDADLRTKSYYSSVNVVNLFINSIIDVFSSEIEKIEKDIQALESYIDNYEYIS
jgi:Mg2+ and Co2+ transporter CorA